MSRCLFLSLKPFYHTSVCHSFLPATVLFIAILRYSQLKPLLKKPWLNILGVVAQSFASLGMTLVANFQLSNDAITHNTGTVLILGFGALVCWVQVILTFQTNINNEGLKAGLFRGLLATAVSLIIILYFFQVAHHEVFQGARSQWLLAMVLNLFIATFSIEFRLSEFTIRCGDGRNPISSTIIAEHHSDYFQ
ncbi:transmembrane protein 150C-like [Mustelus asterias]